MNRSIVDLGAASKLTQDYSGAFAWDSLTYSFMRFFIWW